GTRRGGRRGHPPWAAHRLTHRPSRSVPGEGASSMNVYPDTRQMLLHYLHEVRESLLWKLEGLSERELRMPRTPTGTNLLGLIKHAASIESGYFGEVFGRPWPTPHEVPSDAQLEEDPNADFYATADESAEQIIDLYRRVAEFADATITELPLDAPGRVPWW